MLDAYIVDEIKKRSGSRKEERPVLRLPLEVPEMPVTPPPEYPRVIRIQVIQDE